MQCRSCGTEIAGKALICYRCGTATTDPKFRAPPPGRRSSRPNLVASILALVLLVLFAMYMGRAATGDMPRTLSWAVVVIAAVLVVLRLVTVARRRR